MKTDAEKLDYIYQYIQAQNQPVSEPQKQKAELTFEVYAKDMPRTMTYLNAVKAVDALGKGWRIPTLEELRLMYKNKDAIGGFCTEDNGGSGYPDWYWSSTEGRDDSSYVHIVRFLDGNEYWDLKDYYRLSCRPVRVVAASSAPSLD